MRRYRLLVTGKVQGVGFRYFVQKNAVDKELTGFVRNLDSGQVEAEVQGPDGFIDEFYKIILKGNFFSKVEKVEVEEVEVKKETGLFKVRY